MQNPVETRSCCFQWDIFNPFIPWRNLEATFYHEFPIVTQWKAIIRPVDRRVNFWKFSFALEFDEWFDRRYEIVAERIMVLIRLNGAFITRKVVPNYCFCRDNKYIFDFNEMAFAYPQMEPHHFCIKIEISLSGRAAIGVGNGFFTEDDDLIWLSRNLRNLLRESQYSNMKLMPGDCLEPIHAHSYIIDARWNNFFCLHPFNAEALNTVETNISRALLIDVLTYMYSGALSRNGPDWESSAYTTELFQVIDRYKLYHLYKVFVKSDSRQVRVTRNSVLIESRLFPLNGFNGRPIKRASYTWHVEPKPGYEFIYKIRVWKDSLHRPWLSYSLRSKSSSRVHVQVNLEVMKRVEENDLRRVRSFHERNFTIDPDETVETRRVLFLGCSETFGGINSSSSDGSGIKYFIRCFLNVINGATINQVMSVHGDILQSELERFFVLGDHMHKMRMLKVDADLHIHSRSAGLRLLDEYVYVEKIHRGIFASRVPNYWEGLENVPRPNDLPETATCTLSNLTLPVLLDYIYTGKVFTIPFPLLFEIEDFANDTLFQSLTDLVNRIRSRWMD